MVAYGCQLCYYYRTYNDTNFFGFDLHNFNKNFHRTIEFAFKSVHFMYLALYTSRETRSGTRGTRRPAHWVNFVSGRVNGISRLGGWFLVPGGDRRPWYQAPSPHCHDDRRSLAADTVDAYLPVHVHVNMPVLSEFDVLSAVRAWFVTAHRRPRVCRKATAQTWFSDVFRQT